MSRGGGARRARSLAALALALAATPACVLRGASPVNRDDLKHWTVRAVLEVQSGAPRREALATAAGLAQVHDARADLPSGLAERLLLLEAVDAERPQRRRVLDALTDAGDPLFERLVENVREWDPLLLAEELEGDALHDAVAGVTTGLMQMGYAVLNANPIGVIRPVARGVDALLGDELEPRDRKRIALHRRFRLEAPDESLWPPEVSALDGEVAKLRAQTYDVELRLVDRLIDEGRLDAAAAHLHVAAELEPESEAVAEAGERLRGLLAARAGRLQRALALEPLERELVLEGDAAAAGVLRDALARLQRGDREGARSLLRDGLPPRDDEVFQGVAAAVLALLDSDAIEGGVEERAVPLRDFARTSPRSAAAARAAARLDTSDFDPYAPVERARASHMERRRAWIFRGAQPDRDPMHRYRVVRQESRRSVLDVLEPVFWIPATLVRWIYATAVDPVDDRPTVEALARFAWVAPDDERQPAALAELVKRYERRGEPRFALAAAKAAGADDTTLARLERQSAEQELERIEALPSVAARWHALGDFLLRHPEGPLAVEAKEQLVRLPVEGDARVLPAAPALAAVPDLDIDRRHADGRADNGEVAPPGLRWVGDRIVYEILDHGVRVRQIVAVDEDQRKRLEALAREWEWRRRAASAETYESMHAGVPAEFYAGIGPGGIAAYPRLLPEEYRAKDRPLFE